MPTNSKHELSRPAVVTPCPRPGEGATYLNVIVEPSGWLVSFDRLNGGAENWTDIVDTFQAAIARLPEFGLVDEVEVLDRGRRLGQGARRRLAPEVAYIVVALWLEDAAVADAFDRTALRITSGELGNPRGIALAKRLLERHREGLHLAIPITDGASEIEVDEVDGTSVEKKEELTNRLAAKEFDDE